MVKKPIILSAKYTDLAELNKAFMPIFKSGGLFIPTSKPLLLGTQVYLLIQLPGSTEQFTVAGRVSWLTPSSGDAGSIVGVGIEFSDAKGRSIRHRIEGVLGHELASDSPRYTL